MSQSIALTNYCIKVLYGDLPSYAYYEDGDNIIELFWDDLLKEEFGILKGHFLDKYPDGSADHIIYLINQIEKEKKLNII